MSANTKKIAFILVIVGLCTSCMHNPYVNRTVVEADGTEVEKFFAYGQYCGPRHPVLRSSFDDALVLTDLSAFPAPIDDLDEVCLLHDKCHQTRYPDVDFCDSAFISILESAMEESPDERCDNLMYDMSSAMSSRRSNYTVPMPFGEASSMAFSRLWRELTNETDEFPEEGTCNFMPLQSEAWGEIDLTETFRRYIVILDFVRKLMNDPDSIDLEAPIDLLWEAPEADAAPK